MKLLKKKKKKKLDLDAAFLFPSKEADQQIWEYFHS